MKIAQFYSHINGLEFLTVHHKNDYDEILNLINNIDLNFFENERDNIRQTVKKSNYSALINKFFTDALNKKGYKELKLDYAISCDPNIVNKIENLEIIKQKTILNASNTQFYLSNQKARFIKNKISVDIHFYHNMTLTYNLFVKNLSFFNKGLINTAIEILPTKNMHSLLHSKVPWFEKEVHNVLRHGRTNPPVPLLILGVEP